MTDHIIVKQTPVIKIVQKGLPGVPGAKGDKGDQGIQGIQGIQGVQGNPGASISLQTNNTANTLQDILNLIAGTGVTLVADGAGGVTISAAGGGGSARGLQPLAVFADTPDNTFFLNNTVFHIFQFNHVIGPQILAANTAKVGDRIRGEIYGFVRSDVSGMLFTGNILLGSVDLGMPQVNLPVGFAGYFALRCSAVFRTIGSTAALNIAAELIAVDLNTHLSYLSEISDTRILNSTVDQDCGADIHMNTASTSNIAQVYETSIDYIPGT